MYDPPTTSAPNAARAATWRRYLRFWGPRAEADVDDELGFHVEMRAREYVSRGLTEADARRAALRRLGNLAAARSECVAITSRRERRMTRAQIVDAFVHDVAYAWRTLGRQKGWTFVAVVTLALGIGANTAVFSVVNTLLLHPLPYPNADRIAIIYQEPTQGNTTGMQLLVNPNTPTVRAWRDGSRSFEMIEPYSREDRSLRETDGTISVVHTASILRTFIAFAGQRPLLGRAFTDAEVARGDKLVLIGEPFWRARLGADPSIIGKPITIDQNPYTIVGVMPATFRIPRLGGEATDVWLPLNLREDPMGLSVIGRLRAGIPIADAARELDGIATSSPLPGAATPDFRTKLTPPSEMVRFRASLVMLSAAVALVLLIACGNVVHLVLARTATRQRELAIRAALGASRFRIVRQLLTESLILSVAGCVGGLVVGWAGLQVLVSMRPASLPELIAARMDVTTLARHRGAVRRNGSRCRNPRCILGGPTLRARRSQGRRAVSLAIAPPAASAIARRHERDGGVDGSARRCRTAGAQHDQLAATRTGLRGRRSLRDRIAGAQGESRNGRRARRVRGAGSRTGGRHPWSRGGDHRGWRAAVTQLSHRRAPDRRRAGSAGGHDVVHRLQRNRAELLPHDAHSHHRRIHPDRHVEDHVASAS